MTGVVSPPSMINWVINSEEVSRTRHISFRAKQLRVLASRVSLLLVINLEGAFLQLTTTLVWMDHRIAMSSKKQIRAHFGQVKRIRKPRTRANSRVILARCGRAHSTRNKLKNVIRMIPKQGVDLRVSGLVYSSRTKRTSSQRRKRKWCWRRGTNRIRMQVEMLTGQLFLSPRKRIHLLIKKPVQSLKDLRKTVKLGMEQHQISIEISMMSLLENIPGTQIRMKLISLQL